MACMRVHAHTRTIIKGILYIATLHDRIKLLAYVLHIRTPYFSMVQGVSLEAWVDESCTLSV